MTDRRTKDGHVSPARTMSRKWEPVSTALNAHPYLPKRLTIRWREPLVSHAGHGRLAAPVAETATSWEKRAWHSRYDAPLPQGQSSSGLGSFRSARVTPIDRSPATTSRPRR